MLKNKNKRNMFSKFIKKFIIGIIIILGVVTVIGGFVSSLENDDSIASKLFKKTGYIEYVERPKEDVQVSVYNADGTPNGLNLLLIQRMNEGYCKEYLEIAQECEEGKISPDCDYKTPVLTLVGVAASEQGTYEESGGYILCSTMGWDSSSKKPVWDKSKGWTLDKLGSKSYDSGAVPYYPNGYRTYNDAGAYTGPFQAVDSYFDNPKYHPSSHSSDDVSSSRNTCDRGYFPDQVSLVNWEREFHSSGVKAATTSNLTNDALELATSVTYSGTDILKAPFTPNSGAEDLTEALNNLSEFTNNIIDKYKDMTTLKDYIDTQQFKWMLTMVLVKEGAKCSQETYDTVVSHSFQRNACKIAMDAYFNGEDALSVLASNIDPTIPYMNNYTGELSLNLKGRTYWLTPESYGHYISEQLNGKLMYARMLVMGGLTDVDPNNPDTYMNKIEQNGEWTPSGNTDWMNEYGIDSSIGEFRLNVLSWAFKCVGLVYDFGGSIDNIKPENFKENADGTLTFPKFDTWDKGLPMSSAGVNGWGFDCGGFTGYCYMKAGATGFPHMSTYSQISSSAVRQVNYSQAKAGDIFFTPSVGHTGIFLKDNGDGTFTYIDSNQSWEGGEVGGTRGSIKVRSGRSYSGYTFVSYVGAD